MRDPLSNSPTVGSLIDKSCIPMPIASTAEQHIEKQSCRSDSVYRSANDFYFYQEPETRIDGMVCESCLFGEYLAERRRRINHPFFFSLARRRPRLFFRFPQTTLVC